MMSSCSLSGQLRREDSEASSTPMSRNASIREETDLEQESYNEELFNPRAVSRPRHDDDTPRPTRPGHPDDTPRATRPRGQAVTTPTITLTSSDLKKIVMDAQAPLIEDIQGLRKELKTAVKRLGTIDTNLGVISKQNKEIFMNTDQKTGTLAKLLTNSGCTQLKNLCLQNLQLEAHSEEENALLSEFLDDAGQNEWIVTDAASAKCVNDIKLRFREERNTLRQQTQKRVKMDYANSSPDHGAQLSKTKMYVTKHVGELARESELVLYHLGYIHAKYLNLKVTMIENDDKKCRRCAENDLWGYLHKRMRKDGAATINDMQVKIQNALRDGFKPLR